MSRHNTKAGLADDTASRRGIQSVDIAMRVLGAIRDAGASVGLTDIARAAGLPASNCHRYLASLARARFVKQDSRTGRYDFGPEMVAAGLAAVARLEPVAVASEILEALVDSSGYTGQLAVWNGEAPVIVRWIVGSIAVRTSVSVGATLPLMTSATGQTFLTYLPRRQTAAAVAEAKANARETAAIIERVRSKGLAVASGSHIPGLSAASAPVLDANGEAVAALTLVGLADGIAPAALLALRDASLDASYALGWKADRCSAAS